MNPTPHPQSALIAGATGLVGQALVEILLASPFYGKVTVLVRRTLSLQHPKLHQVVVDYDRLDEHREAFAVDHVFCCLGTTIKKAKSKEAFAKVDYDYPLALARLAQEQGAKKFLIITAMGADANSSIFYNQVKGRVENALAEENLPALLLLRPSLLLGDRDEFRFGEQVAAWVAKALPFLFTGPLRRYKPIRSTTVATALHNAAQQSVAGRHVFESNQIAELGGKVLQ
ncbi:MAG TPA: NAD(P)H-binding protein [Bacilli bacterium]|nr:NAD(P)H-binding protein [Bacilli bacterium]